MPDFWISSGRLETYDKVHDISKGIGEDTYCWTGNNHKRAESSERPSFLALLIIKFNLRLGRQQTSRFKHLAVSEPLEKKGDILRRG